MLFYSRLGFPKRMRQNNICYNEFMFDRKNAKKLAKYNLKQHYIIFVIACVLAGFLGSAYSETYSEIGTISTSTNVVSNLTHNGTNRFSSLNADKVLTLILEGKTNTANDVANQIEKK